MDTSLIDRSRREHVGEFTILRPLASSDAEVSLGWRIGQRAALLNPGSTTVAEQRDWILSRPSNELNFLIETIKHRPVGLISLVDIDLRQRHAEASRFLIGEEKEVRGLPTAIEAMKLLYLIAFDELDLIRVTSVMPEENTRILKWHKYLGMREEGRLRQHVLINGRLQDLILVGIMEWEFREVTVPRMAALIDLSRASYSDAKE